MYGRIDCQIKVLTKIRYFHAIKNNRKNTISRKEKLSEEYISLSKLTLYSSRCDLMKIMSYIKKSLILQKKLIMNDEL